MADTFDRTLENWKSLTSPAGDLSSFPDRPDVAADHPTRKMAFGFLSPMSARYLQTAKGLANDTGLSPDWTRMICFMPRIFRKPTIRDLPEPGQQHLSESMDNTLFLGIVNHLLLFEHAHRTAVPNCDPDEVFEQWIDRAPIADHQLRDYDAHMNEIPSAIFGRQFDVSVLPVLKQLRVGIFRQGKARSYIKNLFFAGTLLAMTAELEAAS